MKKKTSLQVNTDILLDVLLCSIAEYFLFGVVPYFDEPVKRVKIKQQVKILSDTTQQNVYIIRNLLSNRPNCYVHAGEYMIYLRGMRDRSMRSQTELVREIQLTDWSTAGNLSNRSSGVQIPRDICTPFGRYLYSTKCSWIIKNKSSFVLANEPQCLNKQ